MTDAPDDWSDQPVETGPIDADVDSDTEATQPEPVAGPAASAEVVATGETPSDGAPDTGDAASGARDAASGAGGDGASGTGDGAADEVAILTARVHELEQERDTYLDHLRRERAEFDNYRRRSTRERSEALDRGAETLITQMLSVLDNFGYVLEAAKDHDDAVAKGVRMVHSELRDVLGRAGLEEVPGVGEPFDPTWHDAVMQVEGDTTDDGDPVVAQVLRTGYRFKGRVLRPASVAVTQ